MASPVKEKEIYNLDSEVVVAIENNELEKVEEWLKHHNIDSVDTRKDRIPFKMSKMTDTESYGKTALHYALFFNKFEIAKFLINNDADTSIQDGNGIYPIHLSVFLKDIDEFREIVKMLLYSINFQDKSGDTPLHYAGRVKKFEFMKVLIIEFDADFMKKENRGYLACDPFYHINEFKDEFEFAEFLRLLLKKNSSYSIDFANVRSGRTLLHIAVSNQKYSFVQVLISEFKADPSIPDNLGQYSLHSLGKCEDEVIFTKILQALQESPSFRINAQDKDGRTLLHLVVKNNLSEEHVRILTERFNADYKIPDNEGKFPLHYVKNENSVCRLYERQIILTEDNDRHIPLYYALFNKHHRLVSKLLSYSIHSQMAKISDLLHLITLNEWNDEEFVTMLKTLKLPTTNSLY